MENIAEIESRGLFDLTKLQAMVLCEDTAMLTSIFLGQGVTWRSHKCYKTLWNFALTEKMPRSFELLCAMAKKRYFLVEMVQTLDRLPEALQLWALSIPNVRNVWLSQTETILAREGFLYTNGLKVLNADDTVNALHKNFDTKHELFHAHMRLFIEQLGMQKLMTTGSFLHTIVYYKEPSKKHLRVAATSKDPLYDFTRMERYWPQIEACATALSGIGLSKNDCEERLRQIVSNKQASKIQAQTQALDLPDELNLN